MSAQGGEDQQRQEHRHSAPGCGLEERLSLESPGPNPRETWCVSSATLETTGGHSYLLSANFRAGTIDVLKGDAAAPDLAGKFTDPGTPSGFAPFNIQLLGSRIYVTYAQ